MIIVSYYTPLYKPVAFSRLIPSCESMGLKYDVREVRELGTWQANTQFKPAFLSQMRMEHSGPIVWLDADAEVIRYPTAFDVLEDSYDVAFHRLGGTELLSGTLWLNDTPAVQTLLYQWAAACDEHPNRWDQQCLDLALLRVPHLRTHRLPPEYCFIFDTSKKMYPDTQPVIVHHQASRQLKRKVKA